ncbi:hypothetical protein [Legionella brunensis]|nr:hypothetical protein [Legionella brunensis]
MKHIKGDEELMNNNGEEIILRIHIFHDLLTTNLMRFTIDFTMGSSQV